MEIFSNKHLGNKLAMKSVRQGRDLTGHEVNPFGDVILLANKPASLAQQEA